MISFLVGACAVLLACIVAGLVGWSFRTYILEDDVESTPFDALGCLLIGGLVSGVLIGLAVLAAIVGVGLVGER